MALSGMFCLHELVDKFVLCVCSVGSMVHYTWPGFICFLANSLLSTINYVHLVLIALTGHGDTVTSVSWRENGQVLASACKVGCAHQSCHDDRVCISRVTMIVCA